MDRLSRLGHMGLEIRRGKNEAGRDDWRTNLWLTGGLVASRKLREPRVGVPGGFANEVRQPKIALDDPYSLPSRQFLFAPFAVAIVVVKMGWTRKQSEAEFLPDDDPDNALHDFSLRSAHSIDTRPRR